MVDLYYFPKKISLGFQVDQYFSLFKTVVTVLVRVFSEQIQGTVIFTPLKTNVRWKGHISIGTTSEPTLWFRGHSFVFRGVTLIASHFILKKWGSCGIFLKSWKWWVATSKLRFACSTPKGKVAKIFSQMVVKHGDASKNPQKRHQLNKSKKMGPKISRCLQFMKICFKVPGRVFLNVFFGVDDWGS